MNEMTANEARSVFSIFDDWTTRTTLRENARPRDVTSAGTILRRLDLTLRAPDALNIAIAQRIGAELATFDVRMAECARALGVALAPL